MSAQEQEVDNKDNRRESEGEEEEEEEMQHSPSDHEETASEERNEQQEDDEVTESKSEVTENKNEVIDIGKESKVESNEDTETPPPDDDLRDVESNEIAENDNENETSSIEHSQEEGPPKSVFTSLEEVFEDFPLHDRAAIYERLQDVFSNGHVFHHQWAQLKARKELIDLAYNLLRMYESNGLQLHGYGCWLFAQVVVACGHSLRDSSSVNENQILELLFRVLLEHKPYLHCIRVFQHICQSEVQFFMSICDIGLRIAEELPVPIQSSNYHALLIFSMTFLRSHWEPLRQLGAVEKVFAMLTVISERVESSPRAEDRSRQLVLAMCARLVDDLKRSAGHPDESDESDESGLKSDVKRDISVDMSGDKSGDGNNTSGDIKNDIIGDKSAHVGANVSGDKSVLSDGVSDLRGDGSDDNAGHRLESWDVLFQFLLRWVPLHRSHASLLHEAGLLHLAVEHLLAFLSSTKTDFNASIRSSVQLIEASLCNSQVVRPVAPQFPQLKLTHIKALLQKSDFEYFREAVTLFICAFGNFVSLDSSESQTLEEFLEVFLTSAAMALARVPRAVCESVRVLARSQVLLQLLRQDHFTQKRLSLLSSLEDMLGRQEGSDFDMGNAMCVDAMAALGGWVDNCWKDSLVVDDEAREILRTANVKFMRKGLSLGNRRSVDEKEEEEGEAYGKRSSFSLDLEMTPVEDEDGVPNDDEVIPNSRQRQVSFASKVSSDDVTEFLSDWEVEPTSSVFFKVMKLVGISRNNPLGLVSLDSLDLVSLSEVLVELLTDDRHGINEEEGMEEKCLQLLTDLYPLSESIGNLVSAQVEVVLEILGNWDTFKNPFLVQTCLSALIAMAKESNARRKILSSLDKIETLLRHLSCPHFLIAVLELVEALLPSFPKAGFSQEVLLFGWIMECFSYATKPMIIRACQLMCHVAKHSPPFIYKACSRSEVENHLIDLLAHTEDKELLVIYLRTLDAISRNFNPKPFRIPCSWLSPPSVETFPARIMTSEGFMSVLLDLQEKFGEPFNLIILGYSLNIIPSLIPSIAPSRRGKYIHRFFQTYIPLVAGLLAMITRSHRFCQVPEDEDSDAIIATETTTAKSGHTTDVTPVTEEDTEDNPSTVKEGEEGKEVEKNERLYEELMATRLEAINPVYELLAASVVNTLHCLITLENEDNTDTEELGADKKRLQYYLAYANFFLTTPVCESIVFLMIQLPNNYIAQVKGIVTLAKLLSHGIGARILEECCARVLTSAIISYVDDIEVHHAFCSIITHLARRSDQTRTHLVQAGVHKWLYVVLKGASPETGPSCCRTVVHLVANSPENTAIIGNSGILRPVLLLMETHPNHLPIQVEGLRVLVALCKAKGVYRKVKESKGEGIVSEARKTLAGVLRSYESINTFTYCRDELKSLLDESSPMKLSQQKCTIM